MFGLDNVVFPRSTKYDHEDMESQVGLYPAMQTTRKGELGSDGEGNTTSTSSSTTHSSQSSLESSPIIRPVDIQLELDNLELGVPMKDAFYPPWSHPTPVPSMLELASRLPAGSRPGNFGIVAPGVFRSSFPQSDDYSFIEGLKLKTVVTLVQKEFPQGYVGFLDKNGIQHKVFDMKGTKKEEILVETMKSILRVVLDRRNHPLLIHCNHGRHRTGCVIGVIRKVSGWSLNNVLTEYNAYAAPKARECDVKYLTNFETASMSTIFRDHDNLPSRAYGFFRALLFTAVVLIVWRLAGFHLPTDGVGVADRPERDAKSDE
ncbi:tyrosine phosphatase family-domain-containing protein [Dichotomopilus funicola]|uniref:diphosphoinositol-polyphosphate diphosphatase n=1 Tax=Dichotomopilus funicola TaxID=1934379 RepID=A0AAN6UY51_9PEZI|nr:tyrosine phosphatase family-domain-containing protein [Dichotomopilus funicola]